LHNPVVPDYKKLRVWGKAYALAINADRVASTIRDADHKPLRSQLNRAAMSIPANIVEGRAKLSDKDFARFLEYALGSANEVEHHTMIGRDVGVISETDSSSLLEQVIEVKKMLRALINRLREGGR
jgi:four helix bundle protein